MGKNLLITFLLLALSLSAKSQKSEWNPSDNAMLDGKTIVKVNLLGMPTRNFGVYGERIISKRVSFVLGINSMPEGKIPYINKFTTEQEILDIRISSLSMTPEFRFYLSRSGFSKGFYIAPYYRYEKYKASSYNLEFEDEDYNTQHIMMSGNLNTHSAGAIIGVQWFLGKRKNISLDWTIFGAHYGANSGQLKGYTSYPMSETTQKDIRKTIEDSFGSIKIGNVVPVKTENIVVDENNAQVDIKSPWAFIRSALSVGIRF